MTHSSLIAATPGGRVDISVASLEHVDVTAGTSVDIAATSSAQACELYTGMLTSTFLPTRARDPDV